MNDTRVGIGYDVHRLGGAGPVILCGVPIDHTVGVIATSDGGVAAHALGDALLGGAAVGDMGMFFPSSDPRWQDADSLEMLAECVRLVFDRGFDIINVDVTIIAQEIRVAPHRDAMREKLAAVLRIAPASISVKATTTDRLGHIGAGEGIAAQAVVSLYR